jgi:exonuclease III
MAVKDFVKYEKPIILLIQETKILEDEVSNTRRRLWKYNNIIVVDS